MNEQTIATYPKRIIRNVVPFILTLAFFCQGMAHVRQASITFDEGPHLAVGYATLRTGDFRLQPVHIHPPLANVLAAAPLLLQYDLPDPRMVGGWEINSLSSITDAIVWRYPAPRHIALAGRLPILGLGVILIAIAFRWATDRGGRIAGLIAMTFLVFDPNVVAHSSLITTDIPAVTLILLTLYLTDRWLQQESARVEEKIEVRFQYATLAGIGVALGLAQLTKVSALMLVPVIVSLFILNAWHRSPTRCQVIRPPIYSLLLILITAALTVWAGYGFEVQTVPDLLSLPIPAATHVRIFRSLHQHYNLGHPTFAVGKLSYDGWWWYFPLTFLIKSPLPFLILLALTGVWSVVHLINSGRLDKAWVQYASLWLFPILYGVASLFSSVNIGYRHLLPLLPMLLIGIGLAFNQLRESIEASNYSITWLDVTLLGLILWQAVGTLYLGPNPLAFFNEWGGGPANGYRYLVDSNLDWGQNLWDLKQWMDQHNEDHVNYAHYSPARPQTYGIDASYLPPDPRATSFTPWAPSPGLYAIGATVLQGVYAPTVNTYAWFRSREPVDRLGHAIFLYRVESQLVPGWAVLCKDAGSDDETIRNALSNPQIRIIPLNCAQAQVRPSIGDGFLVMPKTGPEPEDGELELTLRDEQGNITSTVYRVKRPSLQREGTEPALEDTMTFLNYDVTIPSHPRDALVLRTSWRIESQTERPLSIMAHLIAPEGEVVAVGDALDYPIEYWRPGDLITQTHKLEIPEEITSAEYTLRTGVYWLDTMERWSVTTSEDAIDIINLTKVQLP